MTKLFKLTTQNITDIKTAIDTNGKLENALGNHRANFYVTLTGMFQDSGVEMDAFKAAIATGLNAYFGRADRQTEAQVKAKAAPMPQVVIDWAGRVQQTVALGIKPATIKTMSEGEEVRLSQFHAQRPAFGVSNIPERLVPLEAQREFIRGSDSLWKGKRLM